jgi:hypothetical protein
MKQLSKTTKRKLAVTTFIFAAVIGSYVLNTSSLSQINIDYIKQLFDQTKQSDQTDVDRADHLFDSDGLPYLKIANVGEQRHPAWIAIYALAYAGEEAYDSRLTNLRDDRKFSTCIDWLEKNLKQQANGLWVWQYGFDSTYNDISIKAPWSSAFAQATGIQAFLAAYKYKHDPKYLELAKKAAQSLFTPLNDGGFLFQQGNDIWFEEIPQPIDNPSHILNGHMRVLLALKDLADNTDDAEIQGWLKRGTDTLYHWLPLYDAGYWLRYDLNPRKKDLLFRLANPYGFTNHSLAVDKITLHDPLSKQEITIDVGTQGDAEGENRIAGTHWGQIEQLSGRTARKLIPAELENKLEEMSAPHSYFYLSLPGEWKNNLRDQWYELIIDYYDDTQANITVQQRSIGPGQIFRDMRDGDLHLTGSGQWRRWIIPVRPTDLGYWVGQSYAEKHASYLSKIAQWDNKYIPWARISMMYAGLGNATLKETKPMPVFLPKQTPVQPIFELDKNGVVKQFSNSYAKNGIYHPYMIADQAITLGKAIPNNAEIRFSRKHLKRKPALEWLLNSRNYVDQKEYAIYRFPIENRYNDIISKAPWQSCFIQVYALKALVDAVENDRYSNLKLVNDGILKTAKAFAITIQDGGIKATDRKGFSWCEEVPNASHVLNAHIVSIPELANANRFLHSPEVQSLSDIGILAIKEHLHLFDTGYWLRYDLNPKKELLLQIDWQLGEQAPLIDEVLLLNPQTGHFIRVDVGANGDFEGASHINGSDWQSAETIDGKTIRRFINGYSLRSTPVKGGTRHNVYLTLSLPDQEFKDFFDVPDHRLVIRYKDVKQGKLAIKTQAIHAGNQLTFTPLRAGIWSLQGDQQWKEATFVIRPQDLGWYKGPDYQSYEVEQIERIAKLTNDWFFSQYSEKHGFFLEMQRKGLSVIREGVEITAKPVPLKIISSSKTYPEFGYQNSVDGDLNDDYTAGIENESAFVVLKLDQPAKLKALRLTWESEDNLAQHVTVSKVNQDNLDNKIIADIKELKGQISEIPLQTDEKLQFVRIDFDSFKGQSRLLLRQVEVIADTSRILSADLDGIYMTSQDPKNPLNIFRRPITNRIKQLADQLSIGTKSDYEKALRFMDYINDFTLKSLNLTLDEMIITKTGDCTSFASLFLALAATQGIDGHYINLSNFPLNDGHTAAELFIDGGWRFYDPSFNTYFSKKEKPISFNEVRERYQKKQLVTRISKAEKYGLNIYASKEAFIKSNPNGRIGPDKPMIFPLSLDLKVKNKIDSKDFGATSQGANYIGAASINQNQEWTIKGLITGKKYTFFIDPDHIGGDIEEPDYKFILNIDIKNGKLDKESTHIFDFSEKPNSPVGITFTATAPEVFLKLTHPYLGPGFRYISINVYSIQPEK